MLLNDYVDFVKFLNTWRIDVNIPSYSWDTTYTSLFKSSIAKLSATMIPTVMTQHINFLWSYSRIILIVQKTPWWYDNNTKVIQKLINLNTKCGFKLKAFKLFGLVLQRLHNYFTEFNFVLNSEYSAYSTFFGFSREFVNDFYRPDFLVRYIYLYLELVFLIKRVKPRKKLKKRKKQAKVLISYLPPQARVSITTRLINAYITRIVGRYAAPRVADGILYLVFSGKNSFLYKKKLAIYEKLIEKKKFY